MISKIYAIKDELNGFAFPIPMPSDRDAQAWFEDKKQEVRVMRDNPGDFNLYYMGTFDTDSGTIIQHPGKDIKVISKGVERNDKN